MKMQARTETAPIPVIYREETVDADPAMAANLPAFDSLDNTYRSHRERYPPLPQRREEIDLPDVFRKAAGGEQFFLCSLVANEAMVFVTDTHFEQLCQSRHWLLDGTLK